MPNPGGFPCPEHLVDPQWLAAHLGDPRLVIVDAEPEPAFGRGHIPGAAVTPDRNVKDWDTANGLHVKTPEQFAAMCQGLGIGDDTLVVAYDNARSLAAARLWWALRYYGHSNVKVLDGGWRSWVKEGRPISFDPPAPRASVSFTPRADESRRARLDEVKASCSLDGVIIWDTRTEAEYRGTAARRGNQRAGHIPGARHVDTLAFVDAETHRFKPAAVIRQALQEQGITPDKNVLAY